MRFFKKTNLVRGVSGFALTVCMVSMSSMVSAYAADKVTTYQDGKGWKLKVNGKDFYVKGVVWGYTPKDENYTYNLWGKNEAFIRKVLDHDFGLMKKAGVNAVRSFSNIPTKWVTYIYRKHGIMTAINPLLGRYGTTVNGVWRANTDYSDPATRKALIKEGIDAVKKYKNVPGVLMFAFGNESNYGLSWKSFEIENLPVGEQNKAKAKFLYSLFDEVIDAGKKIDPHHPFTIVNGDIQYIDLIAEYGKDWDLLGVNAYRGISFTGLWKDVKAKYNKPVLMFEFGSDAFNAKTFKEDGPSQAKYLKGQWQEMYAKAYGNGAEGNSLGGFVFEWRDEWWKHKQTENLDKHDRTASWSNGGYQFDFAPGVNNMNEEWFGITRLAKVNADGIYPAEPRMAYDVLSDVWKINPYSAGKAAIDRHINSINMAAHKANSQKRNTTLSESKPFRVSGGRIRLEGIKKKLGSDAVRDSGGAMGFIDFEFQPFPGLQADFTVNVAADQAESDFQHRYGDRLDDEDDKGDKVELYSFQGKLELEDFDLKAFYHVPRYHWGDEGDFFGLMQEATDMEKEDIWNNKAPRGVEIVGKNSLDGLKLAVGPEIYWGANPKALLKYRFGKDKQYTFMHAEEYDQRETDSTDTSAAPKQNRQTTLQGKFKIKPDMDLEIGGIISGSAKEGEQYTRLDGNNIVRNEINNEDTLGARAKLTFKPFEGTKAYIGANYAGLVADAGNQVKEPGSNLPYSGLGNKKVLEAGMEFSAGDFKIFPRIFYRDNIVDANPSIEPSVSGNTLYPGVKPRNTLDDPFAVLGNRSVRAAELVVTYDPTPGTYFYQWDNDIREDAKFAYDIGLTFSSYKTATDSHTFYYEDGQRDAAFGTGLPKEDLWVAKSRMVYNPNPNTRAVVKLEAGKQQPTGVPGGGNEYYSVEGKLIKNDTHIFNAKFQNDAWGPYDYDKQFNTTYPRQYELGYTRLLTKGVREGKSSKVGVKAMYRELDENSSNEFYQDGRNKDMLEVQTFFEYRF